MPLLTLFLPTFLPSCQCRCHDGSKISELRGTGVNVDDTLQNRRLNKGNAGEGCCGNDGGNGGKECCGGAGGGAGSGAEPPSGLATLGCAFVDGMVSVSGGKVLDLTGVNAGVIAAIAKKGKKFNLHLFERNGREKRRVRIEKDWMARGLSLVEEEGAPAPKSGVFAWVSLDFSPSGSHLLLTTSYSYPEADAEAGAAVETVTCILKSDNYEWLGCHTHLWPKNSEVSDVKVEADEDGSGILLTATCKGKDEHGHDASFLHSTTFFKDSLESLGSVLAGVHGDKVKGTDYAKGLIPPPMCGFEIKAGSLWGLKSCQIDSSGSGYVEASGGASGIIENFELAKVFQGCGRNVTRCARHLLWINDEDDALVRCNIETGERVQSETAGSPILHIFKSGCGSSYCAVTDDLRVLDFDSARTVNVLLERPRAGCLLPVSTSSSWGGRLGEERVEGDPAEDDPARDDPAAGIPIVVSLSVAGRLYVNDRVLSPSVSSFVVSSHHSFLVYVTKDSAPVLVCDDLDQIRSHDDLEGVDNYENGGTGSESLPGRPVEPNTQVLSCLDNQPMVVLRQHRGNLEGVYPRPLVLRTVRSHLKSREYGRAFDICRRHKIDLNFLCDYMPSEFLRDVGTFVEQVKDQARINLFVSMLQDVDFASTKYKQHEAASPISDPLHFQNKTNRICAALRSKMLEMKAADGADLNLLNPILTTYAKERPANLAAALILIKSQAEGETERPNLTGRPSQEAFKYLAFLATYENLYSTALGMYDWNLAKAVARGSQLDPKVYLKELGDLEGMVAPMARYKVDCKLGRWDRAVRNLWEGGGAPEEVLKIVAERDLHKVALELYEGGRERDMAVKLLADKMVKEGRSKAAVSVYLGIKNFKAAIETAKYCQEWEAVFTYFDSHVPLDDGEDEAYDLGSLAEEIVEIFESSEGERKREDLKAGARILMDYGVEEARETRAVKMLCDGQWWIEAALCSKKHGARQETVLEAAMNYARSSSSDFEERKAKFEVNWDKFVKSKKLFDEKERKRVEMEEGGAEGFYEGGGGGGIGQGSEFSAATTDFSNLSMNSTSSTGSARSYTSGYSGATSTFNVKKTNFGRAKNKARTREMRNAKRMAKKMQPGSVEEVAYYRGVLVECCPSEEERCKTEETVMFLVRNGQLEGLGLRLVESYRDLEKFINELIQQEKATGGVDADGVVVKEMNADVQKLYEFFL